MSTRQRKHRQRIGREARAEQQEARARVIRAMVNDPRLEARARGIRARLRDDLEVLSRATAFPRGAAKLAAQLILIGAERRLALTRWDDLEQAERDVLLGMTDAALLTAMSCGMSRREFAAWLRRTATNISDGFHPSTDTH